MLVDTDILSLYFRNDPAVVARFAAYVSRHRVINLSIITTYEIVSGLLHRDAHRQLERFREFAALNRVLPLSAGAVEWAARFHADTRKAGTPVDDIDLLIAGIAVAHGLGVATRNTTHFRRIPALHIENWAEAL
jgi:tRNA(fMet)-specific endonuclease VapC